MVAVSGCMEDEETSLSISSTLLPSGIVDISLADGQSYHLTEVEAFDAEDYVFLPQDRRKRELDYEEYDYEDDYLVIPKSPRPKSKSSAMSDDYEDYDYEELEDDYLVIPRSPRPKSKSSLRSDDYEEFQKPIVVPEFSGPLPTKVVLETDIKYDNSLLQHFDGSHTKTHDWISAVVELAKPRMSDKSNVMPITLKTGKIDHIDVTIKANEKSARTLTINDSPTSMTSYFCEDISRESKLRGIAGALGSACNTKGYAMNIIELFSTSKSQLKTARGFAHELGHNLGMRSVLLTG